jgi:transitional endoplasmic reticulum ATPase
MTDDSRTVTLKFTENSQARASFAAKMARSFPSHREEISGEVTLHDIHLTNNTSDGESFLRFLSILRIVESWTDSIVEVDGVNLPGSAVIQMLTIGVCYERQRKSGSRYHYCNGYDPRHTPGYFGCRQLQTVNRFTARNGEVRRSENAWYQHGAMDESVFNVDRQHVLSMLSDEADDRMAFLCPAFSRDAVAREVESLPSEISPDTDPRWARDIRPNGTSGVRQANPYENRRGRSRSSVATVPSTQHETTNNDMHRVIPQTKFSDVGGQEMAVNRVRDWVELPLRHPEFFDSVGVSIQTGIILHGPPGTGKTLLARAIAGECDAHLEIVNGPEILSKWVGQTEYTLRDVFDRARRYAPAIILFDEIDAIAPTRDKVTHNHDITLVSQLLALMDGLYERGRIAIVGTTNRLDAIDPALRRPGRFDHSVLMDIPDVVGRQAIFRCHMALMSVSSTVSTKWLAEMTQGATGADIARICREAGLVAIKTAVSAGVADPDCVRIDARHFMKALKEAGYTNAIPTVDVFPRR